MSSTSKCMSAAFSIRPGDFERWLDCKTQQPKDVANLMQPVEDGFFEAISVSDAVNKVANTGPEIQRPGRVEPVTLVKKEKQKPDSGQMDLF